LRDLTAALSAGCQPHLVLTGKSAGLTPEQARQAMPAGALIHADLSALADQLIGQAADSTV
jgi:D-glycero-D-manno-heptose 1,7-bisphosphate phosphatase